LEEEREREDGAEDGRRRLRKKAGREKRLFYEVGQQCQGSLVTIGRTGNRRDGNGQGQLLLSAASERLLGEDEVEVKVKVNSMARRACRLE